MNWLQPGPNCGYTLVRIDDHPWKTLLTMKEVLQLEPGSLVFSGPSKEWHDAYWKPRHPELFENDRKPVFELDTTPIHPHVAESKPRQPFKPYDL